MLDQSWKVDLETGHCHYRAYSESNNPPILHRKELLLPANHPDFQMFSSLTKEAEDIGLFDDPSRIGFLQNWDSLLRFKGYEISGHSLLPLGNEASNSLAVIKESPIIHRHLTALTRTQLSAPMQSLARYGYLDKTRSVFDYGCGKGSDVQLLVESGLDVSGWDPYYATDENKNHADIVNLGFVINVIEDIEERNLALTRAYDLASEVLVVSAMLENANARGGIPFRDGVRTSRNTFQKYFSQAELGAYIESVLGTEPTPVAPGIFYAFKTGEARTRFLTQKSAQRSQLHIHSTRRLSNAKTSRPRIPYHTKQYHNNREILEALWSTWISFGREPKPREISNIDDIRRLLGSYPAALKVLKSVKGDNGSKALESAQCVRKDELIVQFAERSFYRRPISRPLPDRLKEDIKHFFGSLSSAETIGEAHLIQILDKQKVQSACEASSELGLGWLDDGHSLQLHTDLIQRLPPILRIYITCACSIFGDPSSADLVKIHIKSGKLSLMSYDDFTGKAIPKMLVRTKINLRNQRIDVYQYGEEFEPANLYLKSKYMHEDQCGYAEQLLFDEELEQLGIFDFNDFGPSAAEFTKVLRDNRLKIDDFMIKRSMDIPELSGSCGQYFKYIDFIECGETQQSLQIANRPVQPETYTALLDLTMNLLDPIVDYYGMIKLTYGFCSAELSKNISGRIAPKLDQHSSHEINRFGKLVCRRGGAAVDFIVEHEDMFEVSQWISANLEFDRLYYYGQDRPIHLSFSKSPAKQVSVMRHCETTNKLIPRSYTFNTFVALEYSPI